MRGAIRPARTADGAQLAVAPPSSELVVLGGQEVAVQRVVEVDADAAVDVYGGVRDPVARLGRPELRGGDLGAHGRPSASRQAACHR